MYLVFVWLRAIRDVLDYRVICATRMYRDLLDSATTVYVTKLPSSGCDRMLIDYNHQSFVRPRRLRAFESSKPIKLQKDGPQRVVDDCGH
jgi:hypothetical protein